MTTKVQKKPYYIPMVAGRKRPDLGAFQLRSDALQAARLGDAMSDLTLRIPPSVCKALIAFEPMPASKYDIEGMKARAAARRRLEELMDEGRTIEQ